MKKAEWYEKDWKKYKQCTKCKEFKEATPDFFNRWKKWLFWLWNWCKECMHLVYEEQREKVLLRVHEYSMKNKEKIRERDRLKYSNNKDEINKRHKRWRENNKDRMEKYRKEYYLNNRNVIKNKLKDYKNTKSSILWFNWQTFHKKACLFVERNKLRPKVCPICWTIGKTEMHHPSYNSFDDWSKVVFCCTSCHRNIHLWKIECPAPINLLFLI